MLNPNPPHPGHIIAERYLKPLRLDEVQIAGRQFFHGFRRGLLDHGGGFFTEIGGILIRRGSAEQGDMPGGFGSGPGDVAGLLATKGVSGRVKF